MLGELIYLAFMLSPPPVIKSVFGPTETTDYFMR